MKRSLLISIMFLFCAAACAGDFALKVNGVDVPFSVYERVVKSELSEVSAEKLSSEEAGEGINYEEAEKQVRLSVLDKLVEGVLIEQGISKEGITAGDKEIKEKIAEMKNTFPSSAEFHRSIASSGMTIEDLKANIRRQLLLQKLKERVAGDTLITDQEIERFYENNTGAFVSPLRVKAKHIHVATSEEAESILRLLNKGKDFYKVASSYSLPDEELGIDLGFVEKGELLPELEDAVFSLKPGETSGVIELPDGFHIIRVVERHEEKVASLEDARDDIRKFILDEKITSAFQKWLEEEKAVANIEINDKLKYLFEKED
ncbi:MAG: peptidyl-prolyl cis-trans isomerase [Candidatus Saganbacteria bacterium]|nr:peptidyl-prolyl cis-trans isomerase [Candidatus Saganbacteria bacterium]